MKPVFSNKRLLSFQQRLNRLRSLTTLFFLLLIIPVSVFFYMGLNQLEKDQLMQYQRKTEKITQLINKQSFKRATLSNAISSNDFEYYQHVYNPDTQQLTKALSPLATPKYYKRTQGLIGYFQMDQKGQFNSPVWPYIINSQQDINAIKATSKPKSAGRRALTLKLHEIASRSNVLQNLIHQEVLNETTRFDVIADVPDYFILYRVIRINNENMLQGYILDRNIYLNTIILKVLSFIQFESPIALTLHSPLKSTQKRYFFARKNTQNQTELTQPKQLEEPFSQLVIDRKNLNWPLKGYKISYSMSSVQLTSTAIYSIGLMTILMVAIIFGCFGFYLIGVKQLNLAEQRLNFVSSVSHELKTPLTSIRMYSEMLKSGHVLSNEHQNDYYEFIYSESERLTRLINNILQLAKFSQPKNCVNPQYIQLTVLTDIIRSKVSSLIVKNDFQLNISFPFKAPDNVLLFVDIDAFSQVVINITDNAIKFFDHNKIPDANRRKIDFIFSPHPKQKDYIQLLIRDYGVGISPEQESKIFDLFYRGGSELTRTTQGTGIGLALVNELVMAQQGSIEVKRMNPGLAMNISFKYKILT